MLPEPASADPPRGPHAGGCPVDGQSIRVAGLYLRLCVRSRKLLPLEALESLGFAQNRAPLAGFDVTSEGAPRMDALNQETKSRAAIQDTGLLSTGQPNPSEKGPGFACPSTKAAKFLRRPPPRASFGFPSEACEVPPRPPFDGPPPSMFNPRPIFESPISLAANPRGGCCRACASGRSRASCPGSRGPERGAALACAAG